jgi:hypothetical protein
MSYEKLEGLSHWYVLRTNPRQEDRAASNLQAWGVETRNSDRVAITSVRADSIKRLNACFPDISLLDSGRKTCFTRFVSQEEFKV